jgi:PspAA-like protein
MTIFKIKEHLMKSIEKLAIHDLVEEELVKLMSGKGRKESKSGGSGKTLSKKAKAKSRATSSKLKGKLSAKKATRHKQAKPHTKAQTAKAKVKSIGKKIVRIMGHGQFTVDTKILKKLSDIDSTIVALVNTERSDDIEFKKRLSELNDTVMKNGKQVDPREIIKSDIILPSADLSIDEAKRLFRGEGVVPQI